MNKFVIRSENCQFVTSILTESTGKANVHTGSLAMAVEWPEEELKPILEWIGEEYTAVPLESTKITADFTINDTPDLNSFEPVEGKWRARYDGEYMSIYDVGTVLEDLICEKTGLAVEVQLFRENGHEITTPNETFSGSMIVTRR